MLRILELTTAVAVMAAVDSVAKISTEGEIQKTPKLVLEEDSNQDHVWFELSAGANSTLSPSTPHNLPEKTGPAQPSGDVKRSLQARARAPPQSKKPSFRSKAI
jgi:hypothetical protein